MCILHGIHTVFKEYLHLMLWNGLDDEIKGSRSVIQLNVKRLKIIYFQCTFEEILKCKWQYGSIVF